MEAVMFDFRRTDSDCRVNDCESYRKELFTGVSGQQPEVNRERIVFVASQNDNQANGGMESATQIYESLAKAFQWVLITTHDSNFSQRWRQGGARVIIVPFESSGSVIKSRIQWVYWWICVGLVLLRVRPDCVHANDIRACRVVSWASRHLGIPLVFTIRGSKPEDVQYGRHWQRSLDACRVVVTLSKEMTDLISRRLNIEKQRIMTINSIVDLDEFSPPNAWTKRVLRESCGIRDGELAMGIVGAVRKLKGQLCMIEQVLPHLCEIVPSARLHVLGDFEPNRDVYAAKCRLAAVCLNLTDKVIFHGHVENVADWYKALDIIVIASQHEGLARSMIEGMASGVPVVSFDVCSAREMLEEASAGFVVPQCDYEGLGMKVAELARDEKLRERMSTEGRKGAEQRFAAERIIPKYRALYKQAVTGY